MPIRKMILSMAMATMAVSAQATTFFSNGTGLSAPGTVMTFDEAQSPLAPGDIVSYLDNPFAGFGFTFYVAVYQPIADIFDGGYFGNFLTVPSLQIAQNFVIFFDQPQTRAAFKLFTGPEETLFEAYLGQTLVESAAASTGPDSATYYGFDGIMFDAIQITPGYLAQTSGALLDNLQFGTAATVPEPASWLMLIAGFGLVGAAQRRRAVIQVQSDRR